MHTFRERLNARDESGFMLIELLVVLIIIGPDAEAYYSDHNDYSGMTASALQSTYDSGLVISVSNSTGIVSAVPGSTNTQAYCISALSGGHWASVQGLGGQVTNNTANTSDPCAGFTG